jgi:hypothetical protein
MSPPLQAAKKAETVLSQQRYAQLDALLNKAGMYTQFLTEQMQAFAAKDADSTDETGETEQQDTGEARCWAAGFFGPYIRAVVCRTT